MHKNETMFEPEPGRQLGHTDGVQAHPANFVPTFPYLNTPIAGAPDPAAGASSPSSIK